VAEELSSTSSAILLFFWPFQIEDGGSLFLEAEGQLEHFNDSSPSQGIRCGFRLQFKQRQFRNVKKQVDQPNNQTKDVPAENPSID
jgi:hypothetical protein